MVQNKNQQKPPHMFAKGQIVEIFFKLDEFWKKSKSLFRTLFVDGIRLLTRLKTDMKGSFLSAGDSLLIRKRAIIESVNDELMNIAQVEHSRHRSLHDFLVNMMSAISAYCLFPKKPSIRLEPVSDTESCRQLCLF